jgi:hypothetical protein
MMNFLSSSLVAEQNAFPYKHIYGPASAMEEQSWNLTSVLCHHTHVAVVPQHGAKSIH